MIPTSEYRRPPLDGLQFIHDHPAFASTAVYLLVSVTGVIYLAALFRGIGLNVFDLAEPRDFLLAAFRQPVVIFLSFGVICTAWLTYHRKGYKTKKTTWQFAAFGAIRISLLLYLPIGIGFLDSFLLAPDNRLTLEKTLGESVSEAVDTYFAILGPPRYTHITLRRASPRSDRADPVQLDGMMIGTLERYVIVYRPDLRLTSVIPRTSIRSMTFATPTYPWD